MADSRVIIETVATPAKVVRTEEEQRSLAIIEEEVTSIITVEQMGPRGPAGPEGPVTYLAFDAGGDAEAARPDVPVAACVSWRNVPSQPTNMAQFDEWEDLGS